MTATSCCGKAPRDIRIDLHDSSLAFVYCDRCEARQWFRNGTPVDLTSVKDVAAAKWNKRAKNAAPVSA